MHAELGRTADAPAIPWASLWKPLLYESVGWFLGAFLILAGSFYFVAESWAGMATLTRSLVVFGLTGGYAAGFALWGAFLARRPALRGAGRVLELIGAAVAPLAAIPLSMAGAEHAGVALAVSGVWAGAAAALVHRPASAFDAPSRRAVEVAMALTTFVMGTAPLLAPAGSALFWANALPVACLWAAVRSGPPRKTARELVFLLLAPAYLGALFCARLHLALLATGGLPNPGTYAPFAAAMLFVALEARRKYSERNADALDVVTVALQVGCVGAALFGDAPAFFLSCALVTATTSRLARGAPSRVRWLYATYGAGYFAYQSVGQLVPTFLKQLLARIREALGYAPSAPLPFNFDAVYAVPFIAAVAAVAVSLLRRPAPSHLRQRRDVVAQALLRCTSIASVAVGLLAVSGADQRAALWSVPPLVALCLGLGDWLKRPWLTYAGAGLTLLFPIFATALGSPAAASVLTAVAAAGLVALSRRGARTQHDLMCALAAFEGIAAAILAWSAAPSAAGAAALALGGAAAALAARELKNGWLTGALTAIPFSAVSLLLLAWAPAYAGVATGVLAAALALGTSVWSVQRARSPFAISLAAAAVLGAFTSAALSQDLGLFLWASAAAFAATRTLHPSVTVPVGTGLAILGLIPFPPGWMLALAATVSALALLESWPEAWSALAGKRHLALAATLSGLVAAFLAVARTALGPPSGSVPTWLGLVLFGLMPLVWVRATRSPWLALAAAPLWTLWLAATGNVEWIFAVPLAVLVLTRAVHHSACARGLLLPGASPARASTFNTCLLASLAPCALAILALNSTSAPLAAAWFALAFVVSPSRWLPARVVAAALVSAAFPDIRLAVMGGLLALALASRVAPRVGISSASRWTACIAAFALSAASWLFGPQAWEIGLSAGVLFGCALALQQRWLLAPALLIAGASLVRLTPDSCDLLVATALASAALAAALRFTREPLARWASPAWLGAAACTAFALLMIAAGVGASTSSFGLAPLAVIGALLLLTSDRIEGLVGLALTACAVALWVPPGSIPVGLGALGAAASILGARLEARLRTGEVLHWAGLVLCLLGLAFVRDLASSVTPLSFALLAGALWAAARRDDRVEVFAWVATWTTSHVALAWLGLTLATGKPPETLLPYLALASALMAGAALARARRLNGSAIRWVGHLSAGIALAELLRGVLKIGASPAEAAVACAAAALVAVVWAREAVARRDEAAAFGLLPALAVAYLAVRAQGFGAPGLDGGDALAALVAGALLAIARVGTGADEKLRVFRRAALWGSFVVPLIGLGAAPWDRPAVAAALVAGCSSLFAALALSPGQRRVASLLSAAAFNASLVLLWLGTELGDPVYYVLPAGLSALALIRVFRKDLSPGAAAVLRGLAISAIYVASAWRALAFEQLWPLFVCVAVCLVGVASGIALRIRSYVYLGTGILVASVLANLVHYGLRDHRLGAIFLSGFGLAVVAFMVAFTSNRDEVIRRYGLLREAVAEWDA